MDLPSTERRSSASRPLDVLNSEELAERFWEEDRRAVEAVGRARSEIAQAIEMARRALASGGRIVLSGAGTSGRLAVIEAAECWPTFSSKQVQALMAGGENAFLVAREGAEDDGAQGASAVRELAPTAADLFIGVTASGRTPYVWGTLQAARAAGASTVILCCSPPEGDADLAIVLPTGPEALTGSTRLKAGTATKCVLNAITTGAFALLGSVMDGLMVDVVQGNAKLKVRARGIVGTLAGLDTAAAQALLDRAGGEVKTAIVMGRLSLDTGAARARLQAANGHLRRALEDEG